ncbi:helix-turn-helix transcriptional regulator [Bowmanella denitrificans]|uniref:helix-turn-helix transcriptional regulator n=1 Tax=Bowmanella denitrificans TaxID=366582 RepID=UPI000C9C76D0|nr:AlpA family phage regulatory protein [Bowmanella denitrificans]
MQPLAPVLNACGQPIADDDRHVTMKEACLQLGISRKTIDLMIADFRFPPKHFITPGRVGFWQSELTEWHKTGAIGWHQRYGQQLQNEHTQARRKA